jgi:hypothetical protein
MKQKHGHGVYSVISEGIDPHAREHWRIYRRRAKDGVVQTGVCSGSGRMAR